MTRAALAAVQLEIGPDVLASPDAYRAHVDAAVECALEDAGDAEHRFVVLPELSGHLALLALAPPAAHRARTVADAFAAAALRRPLAVLRGATAARLLGPRAAVLAALAPEGERYWRGVIGPLARRTGAWICAGSHVRLAANGDLTAASMLYGPDGRCAAMTDKVNVVPDVEDRGPRALGLARGDAARLPLVDTPVGRACTLIGYDAFAAPHGAEERFVPVGEVLRARGGVALALHPSAALWAWQRGDRGAWAAPFARYAVTAQLVGRALDLAPAGHSEILDARGPIARAPHADRGGHVVATVTC